MAYFTNPNLPKARATALRLLLVDDLPARVVANKCGIHRSTDLCPNKKNAGRECPVFFLAEYFGRCKNRIGKMKAAEADRECLDGLRRRTCGYRTSALNLLIPSTYLRSVPFSLVTSTGQPTGAMSEQSDDSHFQMDCPGIRVTPWGSPRGSSTTRVSMELFPGRTVFPMVMAFIADAFRCYDSHRPCVNITLL